MLLTHHEGGGNSRGSVGEASRAYVEHGDVAKALASMPSFMVADCAILRVRGPLPELPGGDPTTRCLPGLSRALIGFWSHWSADVPAIFEHGRCGSLSAGASLMPHAHAYSRSSPKSAPTTCGR